jgi:5-formyltetrahydrofolate cyclo-ligase
MREEKHRLRARALERRESFSSSEIDLWSHVVQAKAIGFSPYLNADSVVLYSPTGKEVGTEEIRDHSLKKGKRLFYPRLGNNERLDLVQVESVQELRRGRYGILEPVGGRLMTDKDQEHLVVFVPGVAFDVQGNRLGKGGGWYDRVLERLGDKVSIIGLAYEFQLVEELPVERWDRKMHHVITEERIVDCWGFPSSSG